MAGTAARLEGPAAPGRSRWFEKPAAPGSGRMPVLEEAMADAAKAWSDSFGALSTLAAEVTFAGLRDGKVEGIFQRRDMASVVAVLHAPAWNTLLALHFDRRFVAAMVEAMFGGTGDGVTDEEPGREALSPIEARIAEVIAGQAADALTAGFAALAPTPFVFQRIQPKPDAAILGRPTASLSIATLALTTAGRTVELDVVIPQLALEALGALRSGGSQPVPADADPRWTEQLESEVSFAMMVLQASIDAEPMSLGDIAGLRPGQILPLPHAAGSAVMLRCEGGDLFRCELGQSAGLYTVRIEEAAALSRRKPD